MYLRCAFLIPGAVSAAHQPHHVSATVDPHQTGYMHLKVLACADKFCEAL